MNWICPICNGFAASHISCPDCGLPMDDHGRISDYTGDYSPYRPIDDLKKTNGFLDLSCHLCLHSHVCSRCEKRYIVSFQELSEPEVLDNTI